MPMRIAINARKIAGPYGGVNQFVNALEKYLVAHGHEVFRSLAPRLDVILIAIAQDTSGTNAFGSRSIAHYRRAFPNTQVVLRVNTCDEPRGVDLGANRAILAADRLADYSIFVSEFVKQVFIGHGWQDSKPNCVIHNAADEDIFNPRSRAEWKPGQKLRIATHHWSSNYLKGFDIYERFDQLLGLEPYNGMFEFTVIGNVPLGAKFRNATVLPPIHGVELANALKSHHFYLTAARHEPGGNHYIEAMMCGLPVLYLNSGSLPEYCEPYGVEFNLIDFEQKLIEFKEHYPELREKVLSADLGASRMASAYERLFLELAPAAVAKGRFVFNPARLLWTLGWR